VEIFNDIKNIITEELFVEQYEVKEDTNLKIDLDTDHIERDSIFKKIEEKFSVIISSSDLKTLNTVNDIIVFIENKKAA